MPIRIQPTRPYYPRYYLPRPRVPGAPAVGRGGRGAVAPGAIDTSSTGNVGGDIVKAIGNQIQMNRQNAAANQILNTQTPPRAAWVGGTAPAAGIPTWGSAPQTGGVGELQLRQETNKAELSDAIQRAELAAYLKKLNEQPDQTAAALKQAQLALVQARTKKLGEPGKPAKPGKYEPGSSTPEDPGYYDFDHQRADFDSQHGKGSYDRLLANSGYVTQDPNTGKWVEKTDNKGNSLVPIDSQGHKAISVDEDGNVTLGAQGSFPGANIPRSDIQSNMARYDATLNRRGQTPRFIGSGGYMQSQNPQSGITAGDQANPYMPKSTTDLGAIPDGQWFVSPKDNKVYQKQGSQPQKTSQADVVNQGQQVAQTDQNQSAQQPLDTTGGFSLASGMSSPLPPPAPTDLSIGVGLDRTGGAAPPDTGSQSLADAIARAKAQDQLQGVA